MSFGSSSWKEVPANQGERSIVIQGENADHVENVANWFMNHNNVKTMEETNNECFMTFSQMNLNYPFDAKQTEFGSATWKYVSARRGETSIIIKGDKNDVDNLVKWFEDHNSVKMKIEQHGNIIMTFSQFQILCPGQEKNPLFGDATWGLVDEGKTVVINGRNDDHVHNLAQWFMEKNIVKDCEFEICIRFSNSLIETPSTNKWDSDKDSDFEGDENEGDEGEYNEEETISEEFNV